MKTNSTTNTLSEHLPVLNLNMLCKKSDNLQKMHALQIKPYTI